MTWWLSFCNGNLPSGDQFLGAVIVEGDDIAEACARAHDLGINPGGEVLGLEVEAADVGLIPAEWRHRLLSREDCAEFELVMERQKATLQ